MKIVEDTGRVRLIALRDDHNSTGYRLVLETEKKLFWGKKYWIDDETSRNNYMMGYNTLGEFYKDYSVTNLPYMVKLTDDKIREWVCCLDPTVYEFSIIRIGKKHGGKYSIIL